MTNWELHDFGVQHVRGQMGKEGRKIMSYHGNPYLDPSLWFVGADGPEWVIVRAVRFPQSATSPPENWEEVARNCSRLSSKGNFASVSFANCHDPSEGRAEQDVRLLRGSLFKVEYPGLVRLT